MNRPLALTAALLTVLAAACSEWGFEAGPDGELRLHISRARWQLTRPTRYSYELTRLCYCLQEAIGPVRIEVRGDSVLSRTYVATDQPVAARYARYFGPMESVFDVIDDALARDAESLTADYDPARGYPTEVAIDYVKPAVDEELTLRVREFRTLNW